MVLERKILKDLKALEDVYSEISYLELYSTLKIIDYSREAYYNLLYDELEIVYNDQYKKSLLLIELAKQRRDREITKKSLNVDLSDLFKHNPKTYTNLKEQVFVASESTMSRVNQNITTIISDGYREGEGTNTISRNIGNKFKQLKTYESRRIARTEVNSVQNIASFDAYYKDEEIHYHQWWTGEDNRVRDTHQALHGQIVQLGDRFSNGLLHPGDTTGPTGEWINCRCTSIPYIMPLGKTAPHMKEFTEDDLKNIPGWENISVDDALAGNYPGGPNYKPEYVSGLNTQEQLEYEKLLSREGDLGFLERRRLKELKKQKDYVFDFKPLNLHNPPKRPIEDVDLNLLIPKTYKYKNTRYQRVPETDQAQKEFLKKYNIADKLTAEETAFIKGFTEEGSNYLNKYNVGDITRKKALKGWEGVQKSVKNKLGYDLSLDDAMKIYKDKRIFKKGITTKENLILISRNEGDNGLNYFVKYMDPEKNIYTSDRIISSSISSTQDLYGDNVNLILIKKGTKIPYIEDITIANGEFEVLIPQGTKMKLVEDITGNIFVWNPL